MPRRVTSMRSKHLILAGLALCTSLCCAARTYAHIPPGLWVVALMPSCEKHVEGFAARSKDAFAKWRQQQGEDIPKFEPPEVPEHSKQFDLDELRIECEKILDYISDDLRSADPRFTTPQATWNAFVQALRTGDKETIADCFSAADRQKYMRAFGNGTHEQLAEMAKSITHFELAQSIGEDYQEAVVVRADRMAGMVLFVKTKRGWQISQL